MILFSLSGLFKVLLRLFRERKNIRKFGEWAWTLALDCYQDIEGQAERDKQDPGKKNWTKEKKALMFDAQYLDAYEKAMKKTLSVEAIYAIREEAWKYYNETKERSPAPKSTKARLRRAGKARRR